MRGTQVIDREPECVLGCVDNQLKTELQEFWRQHQEPFQSELKAFRALHGGSVALLGQLERPLSRHPAVIARDEAGSIIGIVYVALCEIDSSLELGTHAYFQRMYIVPGSRCFKNRKLANRMFRLFLREFDSAVEWRDYRAEVLLSENVNPELHRAFMRRYFARLGFRMLGANQLGGEVWFRRLYVRSVF
jgi:hypothetical protein